MTHLDVNLLDILGAFVSLGCVAIIALCVVGIARSLRREYRRKP